MNKPIFFNVSLPRAGSTLLQNILAQNPDFHTTSTSGVHDLVFGTFDSFYKSFDFKNQKDYSLCNESMYNYCREGIEGYYSNIDKKFIIDKNRKWLSDLGMLKKIYKQPKIILLIRDLRSIYSSLEKQYLDEPNIKIDLYEKEYLSYNSTILDRIRAYGQMHLINYFFPLLEDIINFKNRDNIYIAKFEDLCKYPQESMDSIYNYLEIPTFTHNFNQIDQVTYENDNYSYFGKHTISSKLTSPPQDWNKILSPIGANFIYEEYNWFFEHFGYSY